MNFPLSDRNLQSYLGQKKLIDSKILNVKPLIQNEYGGSLDCSLVSILTILAFKKPEVKGDLLYWYDTIVKIAKFYFYRSETIGTLPIFISGIMRHVFDKPVVGKYGKDIGFNFKTIKRQIDCGNPLILSVWNDGRGIYKNHSIVVIGYKIYDSAIMLAVYDNWSKEVRYIDYKKLSIISSINYVKAPVTQLDRV